MKNFYLLVAFLFLSLFASSQEPAPKVKPGSTQGLYLEPAIGFSLPIGAYGANKIDDVSGFASPGFLARLNLDWVGQKDYGLAVQYTFQSNALDKSVKNDTLVGMAEPLGTKGWKNHYLIAGLVIMKSPGKFVIEGKALGGIVLSSSPVFRTMDPIFKTSSSNTGTGFAFGVQLGAGYAIAKHVSLKVSVEYLQGYPKIHRQYGAQVIGIDNDGHLIYSAPLNKETKRTISSFNIDAGLLIKLSK
jgi:opacity protein-like surface antigen